MDHQQPVPGFLNKTRRKAVKDTSPNQPSAQATSQRTSRTKPDAATVPPISKDGARSTTNAAAKVSGKRTGVGKGRGMQSAEAGALVQPSGLALALRGYSTRPDLYDLAVAHDPAAIHSAVDAMLRGAATAGPAGIADRQALYRMLGLPWATATSSGATAKDLGAALGAAYGEAVSRLEGHRRHRRDTGREPVTIEALPDNA